MFKSHRIGEYSVLDYRYPTPSPPNWNFSWRNLNVTSTEYHPPPPKKIWNFSWRTYLRCDQHRISPSPILELLIVWWTGCEETPAVSPPRTPSRLTNLPQLQNGKTRLTQLKNICIASLLVIFFV